MGNNSAKLAYASPELRYYGRVSQLTAGGTGNNSESMVMIMGGMVMVMCNYNPNRQQDIANCPDIP